MASSSWCTLTPKARVHTVLHEDYMARALQLARQAYYTTRPNPRVGCLLVKEGRILAEGVHWRAGEPHAEVNALRQAGSAARGATAYVTLEPCSHYGRTPPCTQALIQAGIAQVVVAMQDPNPLVAGRGLAQLTEAGITVIQGVLSAEAHALNQGFIQRMETGRPWLIAKQAMSLDGRTALASGVSQWITGPAARADVQHLRAQSCAIITGVTSLLTDNSRLTVRMAPWVDLPHFQPPTRIILDSQLRTPKDAALFASAAPVLIVGCTEAAERFPERVAELVGAGAELLLQPRLISEHIDLETLLLELGRREFNQVMLEAGACLTGAFLQTGKIDKLYLYIAPCFLGHTARGLLDLPPLNDLQCAPRMQVTDVRALGQDWRFTLQAQGATKNIGQ